MLLLPLRVPAAAAQFPERLAHLLIDLLLGLNDCQSFCCLAHCLYSLVFDGTRADFQEIVPLGTFQGPLGPDVHR